MLETPEVSVEPTPFDRSPGDWKRLVDEHLELVRRYRAMKKGLDRAARIQQSLLPARSPSIVGYEFAHVYQPCEELGGDFYDYVENDEGLVLIISDVIGHGFEAALTTMLMKELFEEVATITTEPVEMLTAMNARLHRVFPEGMFAAAAILELQTEPSQVRFANAGLPYPFVLRPAEGSVEEVELAGFPLGLFNGDSPLNFEARSLSLAPGESLLLGSDGIHAVVGSSDDSFDAGRLRELLHELMGRNGREILDGLLEEVCLGEGESLPDDVNLLAITRVET